MARGAPLGNKRALGNKGAWGDKPWTDTLRRAIVQQDGKVLRRLAEVLIAKACDGDMAAIREIGDRLDGKAHVLLTAEHTGEPLTIQLVSFSALREISANDSDTPAECEQAIHIPARLS